MGYVAIVQQILILRQFSKFDSKTLKMCSALKAQHSLEHNLHIGPLMMITVQILFRKI